MQSKILIGLGIIAVCVFAIVVFWMTRPPGQPPCERFQNSVVKADTMRILEGLPHQYLRREVFEKELKTKPNQKLGDYHFYEATRNLSPDDTTRVAKILQRSSTYNTHVGKFCGGFHPDFAVSWTVDQLEYHALICFHCHEIKLLGPGEELHFDLTKTSHEELKKILRPYHKDVPKSEFDY